MTGAGDTAASTDLPFAIPSTMSASIDRIWAPSAPNCWLQPREAVVKSGRGGNPELVSQVSQLFPVPVVDRNAVLAPLG